MKALTYRLRLLEPVLVAQGQSGEENSAIGLPFIPGSAVRGALAACYLEKNAPSDFAALESPSRALFLDGTVCFLNAYPWKNAQRMLPRPFSWFAEKGEAGNERGTAWDWAVEPEHNLERPKHPTYGKFCALSIPEEAYPDMESENGEAGERESLSELPATATLYTPPRQVNVHIALEEVNQRSEKNAVYRYDALAAGEVLAGVIVAPDGVDLKDLEEILTSNKTLYIGAASSAGYGKAQIEEGIQEVMDWWEYAPGPDPANGEIVVTLLSDTIVRSCDGQVRGDLDAAIADLLGLDGLEATRAYRQSHLVGGFNRKWGLPLAQSWALQAGSVFVYPAGAFETAALESKAAQGIGERTAEGFGRLAVNWHTLPTVNWQPVPKTKPVSRRPQLSASSQAQAQAMAQRRLRLLLDQRLKVYVSRIELRSRPENAELSRVRNAAQNARFTGELSPLKDHIKQLKGARAQFERARIGDATSLLHWINDRLDKTDIQDQLLGTVALPQVAGQVAVLDMKTQSSYTARLIDGVMNKAMKLNQKEAL